MAIKFKTKEQLHEEDLKTLANYRPIDDDFMRELFRDNIPLAEYVLRVITGIDDLKITYQQTQYDLKRLAGSRSICLDIFGEDSKGRKFDLEIQRADNGATPQRARYHSSAMDVEFLNAGEDFTELPITYVIFITERDVMKDNCLIYEFERVNKRTGKPLDDGTHIIFVNGAYDNDSDNSELAKLVHDFRCKDPNEMYTKPLAEREKYFKETQEGVSYMCKAMEDRINEANNEKLVQVALNLLTLGTVSKEDISKATGLTLEEIKKLASEVSRTNA